MDFKQGTVVPIAKQSQEEGELKKEIVEAKQEMQEAVKEVSDEDAREMLAESMKSFDSMFQYFKELQKQNDELNKRLGELSQRQESHQKQIDYQARKVDVVQERQIDSLRQLVLETMAPAAEAFTEVDKVFQEAEQEYLEEMEEIKRLKEHEHRLPSALEDSLGLNRKLKSDFDKVKAISYTLRSSWDRLVRLIKRVDREQEQ